MTTKSTGQPDPSNKMPVSFATKLAALVVGVSKSELEISPEIDHRRVRSIAFSLILLFCWATMGVTVGLTVSLGGFSWPMLGFGTVVGLIVFNIDRAMVDDKFTQDGRREARQRGAQCPEPDGPLKSLRRIFSRFAFALIFAVVVSEVYVKEFLGPDIFAHASEQNQKVNEPVFANAEELAEAEIQAVRDEIAVLDNRAAGILEQQAAELGAATATLKAQRDALTRERGELRNKFESLSERYLCAQKNLIAEEFGGTRCDGTTARPGKGPRHNTAVKTAEELDQERKAVKERIDEIDELLVQLQQANPSPSGSVASAEALLGALSMQRAQAAQVLNDLLNKRDIRINEIALADPDYEPLRDGIILRGEALINMAQESGWVLLTVVSIFLFLFILDLGAVLVMTITPAPENIAVERVMTAAAVGSQIVANRTVEMAAASEIELAAQKRLIAANDQIDALKTQSRVDMAVRRAGETAMYRDIEEGFNSDTQSGPTIH